MIFTPNNLGSFFTISFYAGNVPQILPQMGELTHPPLETLDLR